MYGMRLGCVGCGWDVWDEGKTAASSACVALLTVLARLLSSRMAPGGGLRGDSAGGIGRDPAWRLVGECGGIQQAG